MEKQVPVHDGLFEVDDDRVRLLGGRCRACTRPHFPALDTCPYCASPDTDPAVFGDEATLWAWTAVTAAPPGYRGEIPFGFGVVELPEGLRVITRLTEADPGALRFGEPMRLRVVPLHDDDEGRTVVTW